MWALEDRMEMPARPWASRFVPRRPDGNAGSALGKSISDIGFTFLQIFFNLFYRYSFFYLAYLFTDILFLTDIGFIFLQILFLLSDNLFILFANILSS